MRNVRLAIFETNSSSSHSIALSSKIEINDKLSVDENEICHIYDGEFGWGHESYIDAASKAAYCYTYVRDHGGGIDGQNGKLLIEVIKEQTGARDITFYDTEGYIDHQSDEVCSVAFKDKQTLINFIFNSESTLVIDNDNN